MSALQAVEAVVNQYFRGLHECNIELIQQVFLPNAEIFGYYEGELVNIKLNEYLNILKRMSSPVMLGEDYDMAITALDITGTIAMVKTRYLFEALYYVDYLCLLLINGEWKIVSKTFHHD